jgi:HK97 gp10 family phage protein
MSMTVDTSQLGGLQAKLNAFKESVKTEVAFSGVAAMATVIYDEAKINAPVKSGTLRDAIYRVYSPEKSSDTLKLYRISWNKKKAPHGHLVEFGTSRAPAHPFLRPAASRIVDAIRAGQERMAQKLGEIKGNP